MMQIIYHSDFKKSVQKAPKSQKKKLAKLIEVLRGDPFHPLLHTKRLSGKLAKFLSFRITRDWRVIFKFLSAEAVQLVDVGNRKDIYR